MVNASTVHASRRAALGRLLAAAAAGSGCAADPAGRAPEPTLPLPLQQTLAGGFLAPQVPALGAQARPGTGMYVKLQMPAAVALRWPELLVADLALQRLWRADLMAHTLTPIASAPVGPQTRLVLGADLSAWVLDPPARRVLRYAHGGALMQTWRTAAEAPAPDALAPVDGGLSLLVGDATQGQWAELRSGGALALAVRPRTADGAPVRVDALAASRRAVFVLDRLGRAVHRATRDGQIQHSWHLDELAQASMLAADDQGRVAVLDGSGRHVVLLRDAAPPRVVTADALGLAQIGGLALDGRTLALSDRLRGQVQLHRWEDAA